ncbi:MAG TPA: MmgE/PrpD family protein [Fimbriimonadaceae bacterium]|nr:MmgE/PrpD family protein [Fimbriimonadaceae bacterium]HRJ95567.1 MmgE/PrpD family protein [Fimbriimonadaceae bacterium]
MSSVALPRSSNQALGIGQFAVDFVRGRLGGEPGDVVRERTILFHADAVLCGLSALALQTNAPTLLRAEALTYPDTPGATVFGASSRVKAEKAVVANSAAVREWDSNGTNFGFRPEKGAVAGEFGHNDFYPVVVAGCQERGLGGRDALMGMILLDEIRGRLAEVFSLKTYKIDHVVHGAIGSAAAYGALCGATPEQIESAIGMFVAHYIPWRAIRAGKQLSDSKGASAAISAEAAVLSMKRAMAGFLGPRDIFRNPESMFRQFVRTEGDSAFDLELSYSGDDFAVMGMHFKLGLYEHQSAGALQGVIDIVSNHPEVLDPGAIDEIVITAYEPAFGIIGDLAKRDPHTRQSADHSMVYIVATLLRKALRSRMEGSFALDSSPSHDGVWKRLMLAPEDYSQAAIFDPETRAIMERIRFEHGGPEYDAKYPDGIPTRVVIRTSRGRTYDSGLVMYPAGHARNTSADLRSILTHKFQVLGSLALTDPVPFIDRLMSLEQLSPAELAELTNLPIVTREPID